MKDRSNVVGDYSQKRRPPEPEPKGCWEWSEALGKWIYSKPISEAPTSVTEMLEQRRRRGF